MSDELILSAYQSDNAPVFERIVDLHVPEKARIADVTYGEGVFWNDVDTDQFQLHRSDIDPDKSLDFDEGVDCRNLPYEDGSVDAVVLDPPYSSGHYRRRGERTDKSDFPERYGVPSWMETDDLPKYHEAVRAMYDAAGAEAHRALKDGGVLIVKTMDEVVNHDNKFTHVEILNDYEEIGFDCRDLFVVVRKDKPTVVGMNNQVHARKNHSYFLVFEKQ